jgi:hypothetical protein
MQNHYRLQTFKTIYKISGRFLAWFGSDNPLKLYYEIYNKVQRQVLKYVYAKKSKQCYRKREVAIYNQPLVGF